MEKIVLTQSGAKIQEDLDFTENLYIEFSSGNTYSVDDVVRYGEKLYKCHTAVETAGAWTGNTNWKEIKANELSSKLMISITHAELKALRDAGKLVAGQQYRITDYECSTSQHNTKTKHNRFDIIVTANDERTLNENARACHSEADGLKGFHSETWGETFTRYPQADGDFEGNHYFAFSDGGWLLYTKTLMAVPTPETVYDFCDATEQYGVNIANAVSYDTLDDEGESVDEYTGDLHFSTSKVEAWELKYCLDNDTKRFAWADDLDVLAIRVWSQGENDTFIYKRYPQGDNNNRFAWAYVKNSGEHKTFYDDIDYSDSNIQTNDIIYTDVLRPALGTTLIMSGDEVELYEYHYLGKGVVYYMKDEWNNECPYDFKNILQLSYAEGYYLYTFNYWYNESGTGGDSEDDSVDASIFGNDGTLTSDDDMIYGVKNNIIKPLYEEDIEINRMKLNKNILYAIESDDAYFYGWNNIVMEENCHDNDIHGSSCRNIVLGKRCASNYFYDNINEIEFGVSCSHNTIYQSCYNITLGNSCVRNEIYQESGNIVLGANSSDNYFDEGCGFIEFGMGCHGNQLGTSVSNVVFVEDCSSNTIGNDCSNIIFESGCNNNEIAYQCYQISFGQDCDSNTIDYETTNVTFGAYCRDNEVKYNSSNITFDSDCSNNSFSDSVDNIKFGSGCKTNHFSSITGKVTFGNGCYDNSFYGAECLCIGNNCHDINSASGQKPQSVTVGSNCSNIILGDCKATNIGNWCSNIEVRSNASGVSIGNNCSYIIVNLNASGVSIGNNCSHIDVGVYAYNVVIDIDVKYVDLRSWVTGNNYTVKNIYIASGCSYINLKTDNEGLVGRAQNVHISHAVSGTSSSNRLDIIVTRDATYETQVIKGSDGNVYSAYFNGTSYVYTQV